MDMGGNRDGNEEREYREPKPAHTGRKKPVTELEELLENEEEEHTLTETFISRSQTGELLPPPLGQRCLAGAVDLLLLVFVEGLVLLGALKIVGKWPEAGTVVEGPQLSLIFAGLFLHGLATYLYFGFGYRFFSGTPGKWAIGARVVDTRSQGPLRNMLRALARETVGKLASVLPLGAGIWIGAFRPDRRMLHDLLFDTRVEYRPNLFHGKREPKAKDLAA